MPQNIFNTYDGCTNFWQWGTEQKMIVLDEENAEVHFSNRNMTHSVNRDVYKEQDDVMSKEDKANFDFAIADIKIDDIDVEELNTMLEEVLV